jgi:hypothetical protein
MIYEHLVVRSPLPIKVIDKWHLTSSCQRVMICAGFIQIRKKPSNTPDRKKHIQRDFFAMDPLFVSPAMSREIT